MAKILKGDRIGKEAILRTGCSAVIFDASRERILLTRRTDNNQWCLPGGGTDPGESVTETCLREIWEETGLQARVTRLIGIYSSPHRIIQYNDGNKVQIIGLCFEAEIISGELMLNEEVSEFGYFTPAEIETLDIMEHHRERVVDALAYQQEPFIR